MFVGHRKAFKASCLKTKADAGNL